MNTATQLLALSFATLLPFDDLPAAEVQIKNPVTGELLPLFVEVMGPEHPQRKKVAFQATRRVREGMVKTGKPSFDDPAQEDAEEPERLADLTLGWRTTPGSGVELPAFSREAAVALFAAKPWLRHQVKLALDERDRFIKSCAAS